LKRKSDYAIVMSCTPGYGFGMMSTMNAMEHFGTDADWEVAYDGYTEEQRDAISNAFPFNVNWTSVTELYATTVDKRTDQTCPLNHMWLAYWQMALKVLREKKYKAVCVVQADCFVFVNLDVYFKMAGKGMIACSEHAFSWVNAEELPFGDDKAIWDRSQCPIFDSVNFMNQNHIPLIEDIINFQCEDAFKRESNHSVIALNRAVAKHEKADNILRLERRLWGGDCIWPESKLRVGDNKVYKDNISMSAWHCRWWQIGRVKGEYLNNKIPFQINKDNETFQREWDNNEHNYNLVRDFMKSFNDMKPEVASDMYEKGLLTRERFESEEV